MSSVKSSFLPVTVTLCITGFNSCMNSIKEDTRPNIIFILSDDQGYGDFSCFGNKFVRTPALDSLYKQSTAFSNFIMSPVSAPSRASLMTGRYHYRTGVWDTWKSRCNMYGDEKTVAEYLLEGGYHTALFGKWHLEYNTPLRPIDQGFDFTLTWEEYAKEFQTRIDPVMSINGENPKVYPGFLDDIIFNHAIDFLKKNKNNAKPIFAYVASYLPHDCDTPVVHQTYIDIFKGKGLSPHTMEVYGMIEKLDENIGRLLNEIEDLGLRDNTVIVFSSDNDFHSSFQVAL